MRKLKNEELGRPDLDTFLGQEKLPITIVLDNVRSMHNIGSLFRTADGFSVEQIILCGITARPPHREIEKTALGATQSIQWIYSESIADAIDQLRETNHQIIAVEQAEGSIMLDKFLPDTLKKYALIFGNEVDGVSEEAMKQIDACIEIPQFGTKHSFNIAVSAGIVLWDFWVKMRDGSTY